MKRFFALVLMTLYLVSARPRLERHTAAFWGSFDTFFVVTAYCESKQLFDAALKAAVDSFSELDNFYDRFDYSPELVNIAYLNRNAFQYDVTVDEKLFSLLQYGLKGAQRTGGLVTPTFGTVSAIWYDEVKKSIGAKPPQYEKLRQAAEHVSPKLMRLNPNSKTVRLLSPQTVIDVGAFAKGYAVEEVTRSIAQKGINRIAVSGGGNIKALDPPQGKICWDIGVQNPDGAVFQSGAANISVKLRNAAIATSGDYQRYFWYEGKRYHHLIDPKTLYPSDHYRSVTIVCKSAADADLFSTALFVDDLDSGKLLAERERLAVLWITSDGKNITNKKMDLLIKTK